MKKFDPRSLLGRSLMDATADAFMLQTYSVRVIKDNDVVIELDEEDLSIKDPKCYDVEVKNGIIIFVHVKDYNEFKA